MSRSTIRRIRGAIGWVGIVGIAVMSPGVSWAQFTGLPGLDSTPAPAQDGPVGIVRGMLASPDPKVRAWGAWYAGRDVMTELIPELIVVASRDADAGTMAEWAARDAALDALIQLRAEVPGDLIARLLEHKPEHALILAARNEDTGDTLLEFARANPEGAENWFAAANLLLSRGQRGFARVLITRLPLVVDVYVSEHGRAGAGGGGGGIACGVPGQAPGLPPWASYELTTIASLGDVVLAPRPVPIYYERHLSRAGETEFRSRSFIDGPTSEQRLQYVAALMGISENRLPVRGRASHGIAWKDQPSLDASIPSFRADARRGFATLVRNLVEAGLISKEDAADAEVEPVVQVNVHDLRTNRSTALTTPVMP